MRLSLPTCADCEHYREFYGEHPKRGECYGNLPQIFESGSHTTREIAAPKVRASRPACFAFKALPEGTDTIEKGKQTYFTPTFTRGEMLPDEWRALADQTLGEVHEKLTSIDNALHSRIAGMKGGAAAVVDDTAQPSPSDDIQYPDEEVDPKDIPF